MKELTEKLTLFQPMVFYSPHTTDLMLYPTLLQLHNDVCNLLKRLPTSNTLSAPLDDQITI